MTIPVGWLAPAEKCWDTTIVKRLTEGTLYPHGLNVRHWSGYPRTDGAVLVIPGRYWADHEAKISEAIRFYSWALCFVTSDEESLFDIGAVEHDNIRWWVQTPRHGRDYRGARLFGVGMTPHFSDLPPEPPDKGLGVYLAAQATHQRRRAAFDALENVEGTKLVHETPGFTQGLPVADYTSAMVKAKVAPAPSGAVSPDSFRAFEALEAHCIPIADTMSPVDGVTDYWRRVFDNPPFPILTDYVDLPGYVQDAVQGWPANANRITAWWMRAKRHMAMALRSDLKALGAA